MNSKTRLGNKRREDEFSLLAESRLGLAAPPKLTREIGGCQRGFSR